MYRVGWLVNEIRQASAPGLFASRYKQKLVAIHIGIEILKMHLNKSNSLGGNYTALASCGPSTPIVTCCQTMRPHSNACMGLFYVLNMVRPVLGYRMVLFMGEKGNPGGSSQTLESC